MSIEPMANLKGKTWSNIHSLKNRKMENTDKCQPSTQSYK